LLAIPGGAYITAGRKAVAVPAGVFDLSGKANVDLGSHF
jgi:hypothetical protein